MSSGLHLSELRVWKCAEKPKFDNNTILIEKFHQIFSVKEAFNVQVCSDRHHWNDETLDLKILIALLVRFHDQKPRVKGAVLQDDCKKNRVFIEMSSTTRTHPDGSPLIELKYFRVKQSESEEHKQFMLETLKEYIGPKGKGMVAIDDVTVKEQDNLISYLESTTDLLSKEYKLEFEMEHMKLKKELFRCAFICSNLDGLVPIEPGQMTKPFNSCSNCNSRENLNQCAACKSVYYCNQVTTHFIFFKIA